LKDVARRAGVSTATVSRVLHSNGYTSAVTRERVEEALRESGYRLNAIAQGLRRRQTITLGIILQGGLSNPFYVEVAMGAEHAAAEQGFNVLLFNARGDAKRERESVETLLSRRVDGIVFTTALRAENVRLALDAGVSAVEVERRVCKDAPAVLVDNYEGGNVAMRHLVDLGHRRIGYIGEPLGSDASRRSVAADTVIRRRFDAYRDSLLGADIPYDERTVVAGPYPREQGGWGSIETGATHMRRLLEQSPDITAVFAVSDILAAGALQTLYASGIRVPQQMSVVGFDDTFARYMSPPLTAVVQPMFEMGFKAASLAIRQLEAPHRDRSTEYCPMTLVVRGSTDAPSAKRKAHEG
jgi:DNA-binding LacI/PurR family transcriptional regulator